ncbi:MAG: DUF4876 domain-containing protein, partial [Bacteroidales bacterium]|nr:DUF4876 domain-containing protein [Bacteroidales bacterium]
GVAQFDVQPGSYDILASAYYRATRTAVSGSVAEFLLTDKGIASSSGDYLPPSLALDLNVAVPNALVIREIYYHGSNTLDGASYDKDRYVELYNNSGFGGRTVYLDSLCLSTIFPYNSTTGNNAWAGRDTIALAQMFWVFPGNGSTYPLHPGESCVVALSSAVDHSARATSGLQLNRAHFGAYAEHLTKHEIAAGVPSLVCYMAGQGTAWAFSIHSPAVVIFKPEMGVDAYRRDAATWERYEPGKNSGTKYWHIAKEWIIDGVECVDSPQQSIKRLPSSVDASYVYMRLPHYSGKCVTRKVEDEVQGVKVYQDTNNSEADFAYDQPLNPQLR